MKDYSSPCIGVCVVDDKFVCEGCGRTEQEVEDWYEYEPEQKKETLNRIISNGHDVVVDLADYEGEV